MFPHAKESLFSYNTTLYLHTETDYLTKKRF